jgi:hypothetical protein
VNEEGLEREACALVARVEEEDLAVVLERAGRVVEVLLERRAEAELEIDDVVLAVVELDAATKNVDLGLPALETPVEDV